MASPLQSLIQTGTKLWLDSVDPKLVVKNQKIGVTGATSNPIIIADLIKTGAFDDEMRSLFAKGLNDHDVAWKLTDNIVSRAQEVFHAVWRKTDGDDGWVSFELDPLLEEGANDSNYAAIAKKYIELAVHYAKQQDNRLIKVPATPAGLMALEGMVAAGVNVNVTLVFSERQYFAARDAVWKGAKARAGLTGFKSVYSIFVSRLDVYSEAKLPALNKGQGLVGIVNAKRIWQKNNEFWRQNQTPLKQEIVFASTGTKKPEDAPWKYVEAFAGSDIETNPPQTNDAYEASGRVAKADISTMPAADILADIDQHVDFAELERVLMEEGVAKFIAPQKQLLQTIAAKRASS